VPSNAAPLLLFVAVNAGFPALVREVVAEPVFAVSIYMAVVVA
jgi:hypothetical protein